MTRIVVLAALVACACSRTDNDRPVPASEAPTNTTATPAVRASVSASASASTQAAASDAGPVDWTNPAPCEEGAVKRTVYEPYVGLNAFIAAYKDVMANCTDGETHGTGRMTVVLGAKCGEVRTLRFSEGAFSAGTKTGQCVLGAFKKIKVHPFTGDDLEIAKTFVVP